MRIDVRRQLKKFIHPCLLPVTRNNSLRGLLRRWVQRGSLPLSVWGRLPIDFSFPVDLPEGLHFVYQGFPEDAIARALYWNPFGSWEHQTIRAFCRLAKNARVILDIGANTGVYSLIACTVNPGAKVIAFEPVPEVFERFVHNLALNGYQNRCAANRAAVSNFVGRADLFVPDGNLCTATLLSEGWGGTKGDPVEVMVTTIDHACSEEETVDLAKIEVEGCEDKVFEGMQKILKRFAPIVIFECAPGGPFRTVEEILSQAGYRFFNVHKESPTPIDRLSPENIRTGHWNVLGVPRDKSNALW